MKYIKYFSILLILSSCGGGGGGGGAPAIPFAITIGLTSIVVNEDVTYNGTILATANETAALAYAITAAPVNGVLVLSDDGSISYTPKLEFSGSDEFTYSVTAASKNSTKSATVAITVNNVNDVPVITMVSKANLDKNNILINPNPSFEVTFSDPDNENSELVFSAKIGSTDVPTTFTPGAEGTGSIELNLSSIPQSGFLTVRLIVSDGIDISSDSFQTWLIANKKTVTISQDDDPSDGPRTGSKSNKDYYVYDLIGNTASTSGTKWLIVGDSLSDAADLEAFRSSLLKTINALNDDEISPFFAGYFDIVVVEPVSPDGSSPAAIKTGCYDWAEDVYCIGSADIDTSVFAEFLSDNDLISVLTTITNPDTGRGRGVNLGNTNIQLIRARTEWTLMHELGHAHGEMGDEYLEQHGRPVEAYKDNNVNTTSQSDPFQLKWKHYIDDFTNVAGKDYHVCYSYGDGTYYDDPDLPTDDDDSITTCDCTINAGDFTAGTTPECSKKVGLFEGNYYSYEEDDTYDELNFRPLYASIMNSVTLKYGKVNAEGFAIGSVHNQGFSDAFAALDEFITSDGSNTGIAFDIDANYDTSKLTLKWYVDGVVDASKENLKQVTFQRSSDNSVKIYTWRVFDSSGLISAPDDVADYTDFYEGLFNSSFYWYSRDDEEWKYDPTNLTDLDYGYMDGPMGGSWGINWSKN